VKLPLIEDLSLKSASVEVYALILCASTNSPAYLSLSLLVAQKNKKQLASLIKM
jgi:hypothetical protein